LQLLEEEGHLTSEQSDGKRVYTITESGRQLLAEHQGRGGTESGSARRHGFRMGGAGPEMQELGRSVQALMAGMVQVARHGTPAQIRAATTLLDTARREMYAILAQNDVDEPS